jgi:hypothetical protein
MIIRYLLNGVAIAAALAIAGPVWAQNNPSAGNGMGMPGPNPGGGGGLTPYTGGAPPQPSVGRGFGPKTSGSNYIPPPGATAPPSEATAPPSSTSAAVPMHHAVRHARAMHAHHRYMAHRAALTGDTTAQLNREELARIQAGGPPTPPPGAPMPGEPMAPPSNPSGGNAVGTQGPNPGGPGLTPYTGGAH